MHAAHESSAFSLFWYITYATCVDVSICGWLLARWVIKRRPSPNWMRSGHQSPDLGVQMFALNLPKSSDHFRPWIMVCLILSASARAGHSQGHGIVAKLFTCCQCVAHIPSMTFGKFVAPSWPSPCNVLMYSSRSNLWSGHAAARGPHAFIDKTNMCCLWTFRLQSILPKRSKPEDQRPSRCSERFSMFSKIFHWEMQCVAEPWFVAPRQGRQGPAVPAESQAERRYMASEEGIAVTMRMQGMQGMPCAKVAKVIKTLWCFLRFHHFAPPFSVLSVPFLSYLSSSVPSSDFRCPTIRRGPVLRTDHNTGDDLLTAVAAANDESTVSGDEILVKGFCTVSICFNSF